eukprot:94011-Pleurochrysis_carterae.AAC.1
MQGDADEVPAAAAAAFLSGAAGAQQQATAVEDALHAAARRHAGSMEADVGTAAQADAGGACLAALRAVLDALEVCGATAAANEARVFRAEAG